eukprot:GEMP01015971.1.p1 GENE.GEMP01015971.1~~GEMP01015971.1.p1  ORF type:complete len:960 (+),score=220.45 GEMP01015971.1:32-2881(+)
MRVWCYYALFQRIYSATPNMLALVSHDRDQPATSGATGGLMETPDSGFDEDHGDNDLVARYVDDIYSQSGGVRLRDLQLRPEGEKIYKEFLTVERYAQRAFIWRGLKVENLNFIHDDDKSWLTRKGEPTIITPALLDQPAHPTLQGLTDGGRKHWFHDLLLDFPREDYPHFSLQHVVNLEWNLEHLPIFTNGITEDPRYNDKPGAHAPPPMARPSTDGTADAVTRVAYNDPRYRDSDAVVNYRLNWRDLVKERVDFLPSPSDVDAGDAELMMLLQAGRQIVDRGSDRNFQYDMIVKELQRRGPDTIHIDINVDKILSRRVAPDDIYKYIADAIDMQIERVYQQATSMSPADVTKLLQELADTETATANTYAKFNDPRSHTMARLELNEHALLHDNIDALYQRSNIRREEFHKMTEPVVMKNHRPGSPTYRVHYSDPERRYVSSWTHDPVGPNSKMWYRALWKRLLEPIFQDTVVPELTKTHLRNIVLVHMDNYNRPERLYAYVTRKGEDLVVHCWAVNFNHAEASAVLRHEYEHVMDCSTDICTRRRYSETEDLREMDTLFMDTLKKKIEDIDAAQLELKKGIKAAAQADVDAGVDVSSEEFNVLKAHQRWKALRTTRATWVRALRDVMSNVQEQTFNADHCAGFPSCYARTNAAEAVAEQRAAMRNEATRLALLRRIALDRPGAAKQKRFYDIARDDMEHVAPRLYKLWGKFYENVDRPLWGLLPGERARADRHHQIITLDNTLATKMASDNLAAHFLQRGYNVALWSETFIRLHNPQSVRVGYENYPICQIQSNLRDRPRGLPPLKSILHLVGGSAYDGEEIADQVSKVFDKYTPTGRLNTDRLVPYFEHVRVVWSPYDPFRPSAEMHEGILEELQEELVKHLGKRAVPEDIPMIAERNEGRLFDNAEIWPRDANLYRSTVFEGWNVDNREVWEDIDVAQNIRCQQI